MIYNNLYKIHNSTWDNGTVGHLGHFCKDFSNGHTFSDKQTTANVTHLFVIFCIYNDQGHDKCRLQVKMNYSGYHLQPPLVLPRRGDEDYSVSG